MILKNKTKYLLMAGMPGILTTPLYAQQIYMCKPCPANTYSNGKECVPCGEFQYSDIGSAQCTDLKYEIEYTVSNLTNGQSSDVYLTPGYYALILGGGNGKSYSNSSGGSGAQLQYLLRVDEGTSVTLKAGSNSTNINNASDGAYLKDGDTYYVAGGGGNGGKNDSCSQGPNGGSAPSPANLFGGTGGLFGRNKKCSGYNQSTSGQSCTRYVSPNSSTCYGGAWETNYYYWRNGGNGTTSHKSNTNKFTHLLCSACAKIFKLR